MLLQPWTPEIDCVFKGMKGITEEVMTKFFRIQPRLPHPQKSLMRWSLFGCKEETVRGYDDTILSTCINSGVFSDSDKAKIEELGLGGTAQ